MAGIVYLKTNRFEVTLEGITFRTKDFESLCTLDFLFADGKKTWAHKPIVGLDIIRHPRNPKVILLLLCIGTGCVILRLQAGKALPDPILKFLRDERINFVGFGIQEKGELLSVKEICLENKFVDVGYLAAKRFNDSKYKRSKLGELARKILGIKKMVGLTDASSFERYETIKCAICQLFITSVIGMALLSSQDKKKFEDVPKEMSSILVDEWCNVPKVEKKDPSQDKKRIEDASKNMSSLLVEEWCNMLKVEKKDPPQDKIKLEDVPKKISSLLVEQWCNVLKIDKKDPSQDKKKMEDVPKMSSPLVEDHHQLETIVNQIAQNENHLIDGFIGDSLQLNENCDIYDFLDHGIGVDSKRYSDSFAISKHTSGSKTPLKGILKCPSTNTNKLEVQNEGELPSSSTPSTKNSSPKSQMRRANSKGMNVTFAFQLSDD